MQKSLVSLAAVCLSVLATGCAAIEGETSSRATPTASGPPTGNDLGQIVYLGAQAMADRAGVLAKDRPIIVATMVSVDNYNQSSTFGRLASQLIANRLSQRGYLVKDVTYMRALAVAPGTGEIVLSQEAVRASDAVNAQAVVAGTYAVGGNELYLNMRLLKADSGEILSSADVVIPLTHNTEVLLADANHS
jgi:hypothetical protein